MGNEQITAAVAVAEPAKKRPRLGTILFYSIYGFVMVALLVAVLCLLTPLNDWLVRFEAAQPEHKAAEVFNRLFADPDWADLYAQAGIKDTTYEKADAFAAYMDKKVGDKTLTYFETSAGLSGNRKYVVRLDKEKIATFTLAGGSDDQTQIATWELNSLELFFHRRESVTVQKLPGQTVYINGVPLDESHIIRRISTKAEDYMPDDIHGLRLEQVYVDGLLVKPTVSIKDADGNDVEVIFNEETGMYEAQYTLAQMTEEESRMVLEAAIADAQYSLRAISSATLRQYFDSSSPVYKNIIYTPSYMKDFRSYSFDNSATSVTQYYRYNDTMYSARVTLLLNIVRKNGTVKSLYLDKSYFMARKGDRYLVVQYSNIPLQEQVEQVRLRFMDGTELLSSAMVSGTAANVATPQVTPPEGKVLQGWAVREEDESGKITMTIVLTPDENGNAHVGSALQPMDLYAVYADKEATE